MLGWRRRAKTEREGEANQQRLAELVNQTLMENFGPYGSYAITKRTPGDTDDIFHTVLAASVAHDIVTTLTIHGVFKVDPTAPVAQQRPTPARPLAPVNAVEVSDELQRAVNAAESRSTAATVEATESVSSLRTHAAPQPSSQAAAHSAPQRTQRVGPIHAA